MVEAAEIVSAKLVAARACVLGVLAFRGRFETVIADAKGDMTEALQMVLGVMDWAEQSGVRVYATKTEDHLFGTAPASWVDPTLRGVARWHEESLGSLLWCLDLAEPVPYDDGFDGEKLFRTLPFLSDSPFVTREDMTPREELDAMLEGATLRDTDEIRAERARAELWLWRARQAQQVAEGKAARTEVMPRVAERATQAASEGILEASDGDFLAFGKRYEALGEQEHAIATSIATSRLRALNWACGRAHDWDAVPLDT